LSSSPRASARTTLHLGLAQANTREHAATKNGDSDFTGIARFHAAGNTYPWAKLRQAQKLLRLADKYGAARVDTACARAVMYDAINVARVESIVLQALSAQPSASSPAPVQTTLRFVREPRSFTHSSGGKE
jgi:hypothetical protein